MALRPARDTSGEGTVPVEILDDGAPEPSVLAAAPGRPVRSRPRRRWLVAAAVTGLAGVVVGANVAELRAQDARTAALAGVAGVLAPADDPLTEAWRLDDGGVYAGTVAGLVLVSRSGAGTLEALDSATGERRWVVDAPPGRPWVEQACRPVAAMADADGGQVLTGPADVDPEDTRVLCVRSAVPPAPPPVIEDRVLVLDGISGEVLAAVGGRLPVLAVAVVEGDLLALQFDTDRHLHVTRWDALAGEQEWHWRSPEPMFSPGHLFLTDLRRDGDLVRIEGLTVATLDLGTGSVVDDGAPLTPGTGLARTEVPLPGGRTAVWETQEVPGIGRGHVQDADGTVLHELEAPPIAPSVDDGSVPEVLVTGSAGDTLLLGLDAATGERLWTSEQAGAGALTPLVRVDGVLVVVRGDRVQALELRSGRVLWEAPAHPGFPHVGMTDGEHVLVVTDGATRHLVARGLRDGVEVWRTALPADTQALAVTASGRLLVLTARDVVGLG